MRAAVVALVLLAASPLGDARVVVTAAYGIEGGWVRVEGRVIEDAVPRHAADAAPLSALFENLDALESAEVEGAPVAVRKNHFTVDGVSNASGFFTLTLPLREVPLARGETRLDARTVEVGLGRSPYVTTRPVDVTLLPAGPSVAVISDIDDTVLQTFVRQRARLLTEALLKSAAQLKPVAGAADAYGALARAGVDGFFYVSGSPIAYADRLRFFLDDNGLPAGGLFLKDLGKVGLFAQRDYKLGRIETLLRHLPQTRFILIGDSGEHDPEIYAAIRDRHPDRVLGVIIRRAPGGDHRAGRFDRMLVVGDFVGAANAMTKLIPRTPVRVRSRLRPSLGGL